VAESEPRIALLLDYENLAIGARESGTRFDLEPVHAALASRGRIVVRRAYADWQEFADDRRMLARGNVELIEVPQRLGATRKNAADIKLAVDAVELALERAFIDTFALGTGDSDFTPLVQKLRALDRRVIGIGLRRSTSALLPPACDEFLYYERLAGVEPSATAAGQPSGRPPTRAEAGAATEPLGGEPPVSLNSLVADTLASLQDSAEGPIYASALKRAILRRDPTFSEADHGFRGFGELLRHLAQQGVVELAEGPARGDPGVDFPGGDEENESFAFLETTVRELHRRAPPVLLTGLKTELLRRRPDFDEKALGYRAFLQFCRGAATRGYVSVEWSDRHRDYVLAPVSAAEASR
jgi:uncharacterized protein (TIGR00288 family)